mgnify:CR=1 FL=1
MPLLFLGKFQNFRMNHFAPPEPDPPETHTCPRGSDLIFRKKEKERTRMPLIQCPVCDEQISANALSCPKCGEVLPSKPFAPGFGFYIIVGIVLLVGFCSVVAPPQTTECERKATISGEFVKEFYNACLETR